MRRSFQSMVGGHCTQTTKGKCAYVLQVNSRKGYMLEAEHSVIRWSVWVTAPVATNCIHSFDRSNQGCWFFCHWVFSTLRYLHARCPIHEFLTPPIWTIGFRIARPESFFQQSNSCLYLSVSLRACCNSEDDYGKVEELIHAFFSVCPVRSS